MKICDFVVFANVCFRWEFVPSLALESLLNNNNTTWLWSSLWGLQPCVCVCWLSGIDSQKERAFRKASVGAKIFLVLEARVY